MVSVRLNSDLEKRLNELAATTHRSKSYYIERALEEFLNDRAEYISALSSYENYLNTGKKNISLQELQNKLGFE